MAIGITTMTGMNYGSALQAYSLQRTLKELGADSYTIQLRPKSYILNFFRKYIFPNDEWNFYTRMWRLKSDIIYTPKSRLIKQFWKQNTSIHFYRTRNQLIRGEKETGVFIAGSDQIWNPAYIPNYLYYLQFADKNSQLFSYAVSLATDRIDEESAQFYRDRLSYFSGISVRENTGKKLLMSCTDNEVRLDLDPVFLLKKEIWESIASDRFKNQRFIFLYVIKPNKELCKRVKQISSSIGISVYYIGDFSARGTGIIDLNDASVSDFLSLIKYSALVITNSFHATAFSALMNKKCFSYVPPLSGSRIIDILELLGLQNQVINDDGLEDGIRYSLMNISDENYETLNNRIENLREQSLKYLERIVEAESCT